jgi:hypothetical protein
VIRRRTSLQQALSQVEDGALADVSTIVVNRGWWEALTAAARDGYQTRCTRQGIQLLADDRLSRNYVEVIGGPDRTPESTERRAVSRNEQKPPVPRIVTSKNPPR